MFVISLSNMFVTTSGLAGPSPRLTWDTLEDATKAAIELNALHGLTAYISPADHTDRTVAMINTYSFGYAE